MDGGIYPRIPAPSARRGQVIVVLAVGSILGVAGWALADDAAALRPLARRYADPTQLFEPEESDMEVKQVVVPEKAFVIPPPPAPPIRFAMEEPPAFISSVGATHRLVSAMKAPLVFTPVKSAPVASARQQNLPIASARQQSAPIASARQQSAPIASAPQTNAPTASAMANNSPVGSAPVKTPAGAVSVRRLPRVTQPEAEGPTVRFADAEPPAFTIIRVASPQPFTAPTPAPSAPHLVAPIPNVVTPAEAPSFMIPPPAPPAIVDSVPETPAFSSTAEPLNITITALADQPPPAPGADEAAKSGAPGSFGEVEKLGDAPQSNTLEFLRQQAILLKPGQTQFDWGLNYSVYNVQAAIPVVNGSGTVTGVANERIRLQLMTIPFAVRYGICDGLQAYVNAPLGWSNDETTTDAGGSLTNNFVSMGDISAGFNYQIMKGCGAYRPDVIATLGFIAPTGHSTFATSLLAPTSALGQGFWDITCSVLAVHTIDPIIFYYGGGYVHRFDATFGDNIAVNPGQEFDYVFGVGFAVNPWATISGTFIGNYLTRDGVNGVSIPGSDLDLMRFRVSVTMVKDKHICEPFGEIGMTPDSPSRVGITFTY